MDRKVRSTRSNAGFALPVPPFRRDLSFVDSPHLDRTAWMQRLARTPLPPPPLRNYALGGQRVSTIHVTVEDKGSFEEVRAALRAGLGFPVAQPGAFAVVLAAARSVDVVEVARAQLEAAS